MTGHGYDIESAYEPDTLIWRREASIAGDGLPHEFTLPILPDWEYRFIRLRAVNWSYPPRQVGP